MTNSAVRGYKIRKRGIGCSPGPLSGKRVRIRPVVPCGFEGRSATLTYRYMSWGAYYALLDGFVRGKRLEVVVRPRERELVS